MVAERRPYISERDVASRLKEGLKFRQLSSQAKLSGQRSDNTRFETREWLNRLALGTKYPEQWFALVEGFDSAKKATHWRANLKRRFTRSESNKRAKINTLPLPKAPDGTQTVFDDWEFAVDVNPDPQLVVGEGNEPELAEVWDVLARYNPKEASRPVVK